MWNLTNSGNLINKVESKQDKLVAWKYVSIDENNIINTTYEFWNWIQLWNNEFDTKWPCPTGFHIPTVTEFMVLINTLNSLWITTYKHRMFKMPKAWELIKDDSTPSTSYSKVWVGTYFRMATVNLEWQTWWYIVNHDFEDPYINQTIVDRCEWCSIRPFKNVPVIPDSSWKVISWSRTWVWICWNADLWLITCTADWTNYVTLADKNLWATEVWEWGTEETPEKCWLYYQYWNNHWFDWTEPASTEEVDASWYWPGNYYDEWTFIMSEDWDSNHNLEANDHRWWVATQWTFVDWSDVSNSWVLSVNWQTWNITINPVAMVTLEYWTSTWAEFLEAYEAQSIVYCKVLSSSPQWYRMAFLAYVAYQNWAPSEAEFQYLRSVGNKTSSQPCDQVFIYKLTKSSWTWTTTTRNVAQKDEAWNWMSITFTNWANPKEKFTNTALQVSWDEPTAPTWYLWYDTANGTLKVYDWTQWKSLAYAV